MKRRSAKQSIERKVLSSTEMVKIASLLHEMMPISPNPEVPETVTGSIVGGVWKRLKAVYASGWEVVVNFNARGKVSSTSARLKLTAKVKA